MDNSKQHQAKLGASRLRSVNTKPSAKFVAGQSVLLDNHNNAKATILEAKFNQIPWEYSYVVSPESSDEVLEVMEWGLSA